MRPLGQSIGKTISDIQEKQQDFSITPIIYAGDWYTYAEPMEYIDAHTVQVVNTDVDLTTVFAVGDRLGITQNGVESFFFVTERSSTQLSIEGGDNYTFINDDVESLRFSKVPYPNGFPGMDQFLKSNMNMVSSSTPSSFTYSYPLQTMYFFMTGNRVDVYVEFDIHLSGSAGGGSFSMQADLPIQRTLVSEITLLGQRIMSFVDYNSNITVFPMAVTNGVDGGTVRFLIFGVGTSTYPFATSEWNFIGAGTDKDYFGYPSYSYILNS